MDSRCCRHWTESQPRRSSRRGSEASFWYHRLVHSLLHQFDWVPGRWLSTCQGCHCNHLPFRLCICQTANPWDHRPMLFSFHDAWDIPSDALKPRCHYPDQPSTLCPPELNDLALAKSGVNAMKIAWMSCVRSSVELRLMTPRSLLLSHLRHTLPRSTRHRRYAHQSLTPFPSAATICLPMALLPPRLWCLNQHVRTACDQCFACACAGATLLSSIAVSKARPLGPKDGFGRYWAQDMLKTRSSTSLCKGVVSANTTPKP